MDTQSSQTYSSFERKTFAITNTVSYRYYRWTWTHAGPDNNYTELNELEIFSAAPSAITLRTVTSTAATSPTHGSMFVCAKELEAVTLNTDVIAKISKVGAFASPVTLTLTKLLTIGAYSYYYGEADYNAGTGLSLIHI